MVRVGRSGVQPLRTGDKRAAGANNRVFQWNIGVAMRIDVASAGRSVAENVEIATHAVDAGWGGYWVSEISGVDAVTLAASVGSKLSRGRLGSAIFPMQTRNPMLLAMTAASLDQVAPEGFVLGLGTSTPVIVEGWHATPWGESPLALTRETVDLVKRFLAGERVTTESGRWRYNRAQLTIQPERRIPVYLAALNDRMLELAGEIADGVVLNFVTVDDVRHARERIQIGADRAGRNLDDFEIVVFFRATAVDDFEPVRQRYQSELFTYVMAPVYQKMFARGGYGDLCDEVQALWREKRRDEALAAVSEDLIKGRALVGSASEIDARLADYVAAGVDSAMVFPVSIPTADYVADAKRTVTAMAPAAD